MHELRRVRDQIFELAINGIDCKNSIFAHVRVSVFQTGSTSRNEGFKKLSIFSYFLEEAKSGSAYVLVRMLL